MSTENISGLQILFIDAGLSEIDALLAGVTPGTEIVILNETTPVLDQIAQRLDGESSVEALHILSHGSSGSLDFSAGSLTLDSLTDSTNSTALTTIRDSLSSDADILLYGCDVASGEEGESFLAALAQATGADIAASTDLTGSALLGGDWDLEVATGSIETTSPISAQQLNDYSGTLALPGAHDGTVSGQVFLGGNYIELGISAVGSFGTTVNAPSDFYGTSRSTQVGMSNDADGYGNGTDLRIDYFLPGSPEERWAIGYNGSSYGGFSAKNGNSGNATTLTDTSVTNNTSGDTLSATFDTTVQSTLDVTQVHTFQVDDKYFKTTVTITNVSGGTLTDVRYMRSFDPDNTVYMGGSYTTVNKVENTYSVDGKSVVSATSQAGDSYSSAAGSTAKILFFSSDPRAYVSNFGFSNSNPYAAPEQAKGYTTTSDSAIAITFKLGTMAAGSSVTIEYYTSLDTADIADTVAAIEAASNPAPTFTAFDAPVDTTLEDTQVQITYDDLAAHGNEADQMPDPDNEGSLTTGTVDAFVVTGVESGTLKIGTDAGSATDWNPGTNDVIDATHHAYWTPDLNENNIENGNTALDAFAVKARDTDGLLSSSAVVATVNVTAVNDAPHIASNVSPITLAGINEDQSTVNGASVSELVGPRFTDVDAGASMGGIIIVGDASTAEQGTWQYSTDDGVTWYAVGAVAADNGLALPNDAKLRFVPTEHWNGTPGELTVYVTDNEYAGGYTSADTRDMETDLFASGVSDNTINIGTEVYSVNDLPEFTSAPGAASLTETSAWDDAVDVGKVEVSSGALTGTLSATDQEDVVEDGGTLTFTIRGGTTVDTTVTKDGFYGTLTLDTDTNAWTYTPDNFEAINALGEGIVAEDTFEFKVYDSDGGSVTQTLTITLTGTNDLPVLNSAISDQTFNGQGTWSYQIPADTFTDAEGLDLAYSVTLDGTTLAASFTEPYDAGNPATWMRFDETTRTLTTLPGVDLAALMTDPLSVVVTAEDSVGATIDDTFQITLDVNASNPNPAVGNIAPTSTDDHISLASGAELVLSVDDFGTFSDANGDALAAVKITSLPSDGTLQFYNGSGWSAVQSGDEISRADIDAGNLKFVAGTNATDLSFQVGDGTDFSGDYALTVDVTSTSGGITLDGSDVTTAEASTWTNVYSSDPLSGFGAEDTVRVIVEADGGTIKLTDTTGLTVITTGYGNATDGTATSIAFEGSQAAVNAALQTLQANLDVNPDITLNISTVLGGSAYNPENGHYYEVVTIADSGTISWADAKTAADGMTFDGLQGYLATITSEAENDFILSKLPTDGWIGASDEAVEGEWRWVTGPEAGTLFSVGNDSPVTQPGEYANWNTGEPNDSDPGEDYGEYYASGGSAPGRWNDLNGSALNAYIVEYGGMAEDPAAKVANTTITLTKLDTTPVLSLAGDANYTENAVAKALNPTILITDQDSTTLAGATVTISTGKVVGDSLSFTNDDAATYGNIAAAYNADTGVMTLASDGATATIAQWQAALQSITFESTSDDPGSSRQIQWQVTDPDAHVSNLATTTILVSEVNDAPTVTSLPDVNANAGEALNINIGDIFTDPEGDTITYSATLADGTALPDWLSFDADTHIFSGNPPAGTPYLDLKVIGTDDGTPSAAASTTFRLNLAQPDSGAAASNNSGSITISDDNGGSVALNDQLTATAPVDEDGYTPADVVYQWQVSRDGGTTWSDISGATAQTYTITQNESSSQVRVQAFYTDDGGFAEEPVSNVLVVPALNVTGVVTVTGAPSPGQTLVATVNDANGLTTATPTYTWYRGDSEGAKTTEIGGNFSSYTLTNNDGGKYITVEVSYTDDEGTPETVSDSSSQIQLGIVAPVANNDVGSADEAGGVDNADGGSNASGNLFANDTDANVGDTMALSALRSGATEGLGTIGLLEGSEYVVSGSHGTLRVNKDTGDYTYTVNQWGWSVEDLQSGETLTDSFNYTVNDSTDLSDTGVLTITINGANDAPTMRDLPSSVSVVEDAKTAIPLSPPFSMSDVDSDGDFTIRLTASEGKLSGASKDGVTVTGSESSTLTLTGSLSAVNAWLNADDTLYYTSAPNDNGVAGAVLTLTAEDADGSGEVTLGTVNVDITAANDAPILDLNADNSLADGVVEADALAAGADLGGNDHAVVFRPRGSAVNVVDSDCLITDIDGDTTLVGATAEITAGDWDNSFTIYETLTSTAGASYVGGSGTITITGNGTGSNGLTGATQLTFSGEASFDDYQAVLETIQYNNSLDSAFAGSRSVTITVLDKAPVDGGLESNSASFTIDAANTDIAVGQMIYIDGVDSGQTVATVIDSTHFVASGPLTDLNDGDSLSFTLDGSSITTATAKADLEATGYVAAAATTTVMVLWTPVVDLNGNATAGTDHTTSFTEGDAGASISTPDALVTDQDGNLQSLTLEIQNPVDGDDDILFLSSAVVSNLAANGITTTFYDEGGAEVANGDNGVHKIVFSGNKDATYFQLGLRAVEYKNTSENPDVTPRVITVNIVDQAGNDGVPASTTINIIPVNDAPVIDTNIAATVLEGGVVVVGNGNLSSSDVDDDDASLRYVVTDAPDHGTLFRDNNGNDEVDAGEALAVDGTFTQSDIDANVIKYVHDGSETDADAFGFKVEDGLEDGVTAPSGTFDLGITPVNDVPVGQPTISGVLEPGETLTANTDGISDGDGPETLIFSYQWQADGVDIVGATNQTFDLTTDQSGKEITVVVTYTDDGGTTENLTSDATDSIGYINSDPAGAVAIIDDGTPQAGETLTVDTSGVTDADGLGPFTYQWQVSTDGGITWNDVESATDSTYTLPVDAAVDDQYQVIVNYTDGHGFSESLTSGSVTLVDVAAEPNHEPWLDAVGDNPGAIDGSVALFSAVSVDTVEDGQLITELVLTVSGLADGADEKLTIDGEDIELSDGINGATASGAVDYSVDVVGDTATLTLTHVGLSEAEAQALVEGLAYKNTKTDGAEPPSADPTAGLRVVTLISLTDDGGTADGGDDSGAIGLSSTVDVGPSGANTAPIASGDNAADVLEGGVLTFAGADVAATDTEQQAGLRVVLDSDPTSGTLFRDIDGDGLVDDGEALSATDSFALADIASGRIKYLHDGSDSASDSFTYHVTDGLVSSDSDGVTDGDQPETFTVTTTPVNDAPTLTAIASDPAFTEGDAAVALFSGSDASPIEADQSLTELVVQVSGLRDGSDETLTLDGTSIVLTHGTTGTTAGAVGVDYNVSITGGTATVTLTKAADSATWNGLIDALAYENTSEDPTEGSRAVTLQSLSDDGGTANGGVDQADIAVTSTVTVGASNSAPTLTPVDFNVNEGGSFTLSSTQIAAADVDTPLGDLVYTVETAPSQGTLYLDGNSNGQLDDGEALASSATFNHADLISGAVRYQHDGSENSDSFTVTVSDGESSSGAATVNVVRTPVNDAPSILGLGSDVLNYPANSGSKSIEQGADASVVDPDSTDFDGGVLRVSIDFNRDPVHDVLSIVNVGTAAGQIGVVGSAVSYGGTQIGTFTGGTGTSDLVVTLNANASADAVAALVKAVNFSNSDAEPDATSRSISFALSDGDGGQSAPVAVNVNIETDATPGISIANGFFIIENTQLVTALSATDGGYPPVTFSVSDTVDAGNNPDADLFEIVSGNILRFAAAPDFETPEDSGSDNVYNVIIRATNEVGAYSEQALAITVLDQDPEEGVGVGDTDAPVFGYATVNGNILTMTYTDASYLDSINSPSTGAFSVNVNGSNRSVSSVAIDASGRKVTLTLAAAVANGDTVSVSYTDSTAGDDANAIQDVLGNDAASLVNASVSNLTPGSGGGTPDSGGTLNHAPIFTGAVDFTLFENQTNVATVTAVDVDGDAVVFTISGGDDADLFTLTPSGELSFIAAPDFELPADADGDNVYLVDVTSADGRGGTTLQSLSITVTDVDETGGTIPPGNEDLAPPIDNEGTVGDGNGDGLPDSGQGLVASVVFRETDHITTDPEAPVTFVTLVADSLEGKEDTGDDNQATLFSVTQLDAPDDLPDGISMPLGLLSFTVDVENVGETETFSLYVESGLDINGYWKQDADGDWVNLASSAYGGAVVEEGNKIRLDFQITDGGEFDADGEANGIIVDPGAPGYMDSPAVDVIRFYNPSSMLHMYSAMDGEIDVLSGENSGWVVEGPAFQVDADDCCDVYRFFNAFNGDHFFTANEAEAQGLMANEASGYTYEGIAFQVSDTGSVDAAINRYYNAETGEHFYTDSAQEGIIVTGQLGYVYEGVLGYGA
nr:DUF4347 domain-containing protein [uncultured Desulfuromonas sp.]